MALFEEFKQKESISRIPKHNIKRLGEDYFKTEKNYDESIETDNHQ
jgi:hypothetical protein